MKHKGEGPGFLSTAIVFVMAAGGIFAAARRDLKFTYLGLKEGLSQSTVYGIQKDHNGFMWFATKDGLNRYDGIKFFTYNHELDNPESLSSNNISVICEDRQGKLWIGTGGGGLNLMENGSGRFRHYRHDPRNPGSVSDDSISAICQDRRGNLWVGTEQGLDCMLVGSETFIHFRPNAQDPGTVAGRSVEFIVKSNDGRVWIGLQDRGMDCYDPKTGRFRHYRCDPANPQTLEGDSVLSACTAPDGAIWIGSQTGLSRLDPGSDIVTRFREEKLAQVTGISADAKGNIWAGTREDGVFFLDAASRRFRRYQYDRNNPEGISSNSILSMLVDDCSNLWVGTNGLGISKASLESKRFNNFTHEAGNPDSLNFLSIRTIYESRDRMLYIGGYGGLDRYDSKTGEWKHYVSVEKKPGFLSNPNVYVLCPNSHDEKDLIWIGTEGGGLNAFDPVTQRFTVNPIAGLGETMVFALYRDRESCLWIGTNRGLFRYDTKSKQARFFDLGKMGVVEADSEVMPDIRCIYEEKGEILWIGTSRHGLLTFDRKNERFRRFSHDPQNLRSLSNNWVTSVYESNSGELWLGTNGGGLNLMDRDSGNFTYFTTKKGLPNDVVYGILEDEAGNLWLSTNLGLSRFDPRTRIFRNFDEKDGLFGNEFNGGAFHKSRWSGEMFFGGVNGMTAFFPSEIKDDPHVPSVVITDFKIFNRTVVPGPNAVLQKSISETTEITLSYRDSMITFEFIGLHYVAPAKNLYAYRMEGFDPEWNSIDAQRRFATYTNLDPGRYTFRVKAANSDGVWNEKGTALKIFIKPPFWKTWWFMLLSVLSACLLLAGFYRSRVRRLEKRKAELEQLVEQRTLELKEASLRDPLTGLRNRRFIKEVLKTDISAFVSSKKYLLQHPHRRDENVEKTVFGIFMVDIDHFKEVNDIYGHEAGDNMLVQFSDILQRSVRQDDVVVRMGGEEFLIILKKADPDSLVAFARKIKDRIEAHPFDLQADPPVRLRKTCSIGFTAFPFHRDKPDWLSFEQVVSLADLGLLHAKASGRNAAVHVLPGENVPGHDQIGAFLSSIDESINGRFLRVDIFK